MPGARTISTRENQRSRRFRHLTQALLVSTAVSCWTCAPPVEDEVTRDNVPAVQPSAEVEEVAAVQPEAAGPKRARSRQPSLKAVELILEAGTPDGDLSLDVRFENVTESGFGLATRELSGGDFELRDADGNHYPPLSWSSELEAIVPPEGFGPGRRIRGTVTFRRPYGAEPLELRFPDFDPIVFRGRDLARPVAWRKDFALHRTNHFLVFSDLEIEKHIFDISNEIEGAYAELYRQGLPMSSGYVCATLA